MKSRPVLTWLNTNLGLLLLALVLAFIVWLSAVFSADPNEACTAPTRFPLELQGLPEEIRVFGDIPADASIELFAPRSVCREMADDSMSVRAYVNLNGFEPGTYTVPVTYEIAVDYEPVRLNEYSPKELTITLEEYVTRMLPITLDVNGDPAPGYTAGGTILSDSRVEVSGIRSLVDMVETALVSINLTDAVEDLNVSRPVTLLDENGDPVSGLEVSPASVSVRQVIERPGSFREVSVRVQYDGSPEPGYRLTSITSTPQIITVFSNDPELIRNLPGFVETEVIDLSGATGNIEVRVRLQLPDGVFVDGEQSVLVQFGIAPIESTLTLTLPVEIIGLLPTLGVELDPLTVDVQLSGPVPSLNNLEPGDVRVVLDLAGYVAGSYPVVPRVEILPLGITQELVIPETIQVLIFELPTPTPDSSAALTPTPVATPTPGQTPTGTP